MALCKTHKPKMMVETCPQCLLAIVNENEKQAERIEELERDIDDIAIHSLHLLWIVDSEKYPELKHYFDAGPRGLNQHIVEIQKHCAEAGSKVAQTGKIET